MLLTLLAVNSFSDGLVSICLCAVSVGLFVISIVNKKLRQVSVVPTVILGIAVACLLLFVSDSDYKDALNFKGENLSVMGTVSESTEFNSENGRHYCVVKLGEISGEKVKGKIRLSFSETRDEISHESFNIGDKVSFTATVYEVGEGNEEIKRYYRSHGVNLGAYKIRDLTIETPAYRSLYYYANQLKEKATDIILRHFSMETAGLMIAVLSGDKSYISDEFYEMSCASGAIHLMAVSGLHLSVWVFFVGRLLEERKRKSRKPYLIMLVCVIFIMNFASFTGSVKRAGLMAALYLVGKLINKDSDALNSLGFAVTAVLIFNPYAVYDVGFMLSLFSTLGILVMGFPVSDRLLKSRKSLLEGTVRLKSETAVTESVLVSVSVALFTLPIMIYYFGYISSVSVITNLLLLPVCMLLVISSGMFALFSTLPILSTALGLLSRWICFYVIKVVSFMGSLNFAKIYLNYDFLFPFSILCTVGISLCLVIKSKKYKKCIATALSLIFVLCFSYEYVHKLGAYEITDFSSDGTCYIVSVRNKGVVVGFSGNYYIYDNILDFTEKTGVEIEAVLPDDNAEYLKLNYAEYELGAEIIEGDCSISLYGVCEIQKKNGVVSIYGKKS